MEINKQNIQAAKDTLTASLNENTEVVEHKAGELADVVSSIGQRNTTALGDNEIAEFFTPEEYQKNIDDYIIHTQSTSPTTGRTFDRVYALCKRYFKVGNNKVGEHLAFIDVGGMVRYHFDLTGLEADAEGKIKGARRSVIPGDFNTKLESYKLPWAMLMQFLGGNKVKATRSSDKLFFQEFVNRQPVPDKYVEQNYMVYGFVKN
jgi:hypothetical protein